MTIISLETNGIGAHDLQMQHPRTEIWLDGYIAVPEELTDKVNATGGYCDLILDADGNLTGITPLDKPIDPQRERTLEALRQACSTAIIGGVDVETTQGLEHFSLKLEDQNNINFQYARAAAGAEAVLYHADGKECRIFSPAEIAALAAQAAAHVTYHTTYFNFLKVWVNRAEDAAELAGITYGAKLPDDLDEQMTALLEATAEGGV